MGFALPWILSSFLISLKLWKPSVALALQEVLPEAMGSRGGLGSLLLGPSELRLNSPFGVKE